MCEFDNSFSVLSTLNEIMNGFPELLITLDNMSDNDVMMPLNLFMGRCSEAFNPGIKDLTDFVNGERDKLIASVRYTMDTNAAVTEDLMQWGTVLKRSPLIPRGKCHQLDLLRKHTSVDAAGFLMADNIRVVCRANNAEYFVHTTGALLRKKRKDEPGTSRYIPEFTTGLPSDMSSYEYILERRVYGK